MDTPKVHKRKGWKVINARVPEALLKKFREKIPKGSRSRYIRLCLENLSEDVTFLELQEALTVKQLEGLQHKIRQMKIDKEIAYRKRETIGGN